ncbi:hypothetical protein BDV93DRAFT_517386 [Ceratobasidium sp. AG-I]|nr:hypothetical protein BDV93DRAFT_517386 [Ceratobasidium sp. AG-I]
MGIFTCRLPFNVSSQICQLASACSAANSLAATLRSEGRKTTISTDRCNNIVFTLEMLSRLREL